MKGRSDPDSGDLKTILKRRRIGNSARVSPVTLPLLLAAAIFPARAQAPQAVRSPEVSSDRRVTFRLRAPNAKEVFLSREGAQRLAMQKDEQGVWSVTTDPLEPDLYGYAFVVDGVNLIDPGNPLMKPNLLNTQSMVHVPGSADLPWEVNDVPHGTVHRHFYKSKVVGDERDFYVYTPPGYDPNARKQYPVLYLLHGFSDDASGWTAVGRAHVILDNLIAQGKAKPVLIVMPLGYGAPEIVFPNFGGFRDPNLSQRNFDRFRDALIAEVIPAVEKAYRVSKERDSRAIARLSMGGAESHFVGLNALDRFAWIGAFGFGGLNQEFDLVFPALDSKAISRLRQRILFTAASYLYALDAETGQPIPTFGEKGRVDLRQGLDRDGPHRRVHATTPGVVFKNLLILGSHVGEGTDAAAPGHVRAFNGRTGRRVWIFQPRTRIRGSSATRHGAWIHGRRRAPPTAGAGCRWMQSAALSISPQGLLPMTPTAPTGPVRTYSATRSWR